MEFFNLNEVTAKAKVTNVVGSECAITLTCFVKEFSYICNDSIFHIGNVVFEDYSQKITITILREPRQIDASIVQAYSKAKKLVKGDIIEFTLHRDGNLYAINVIESKKDTSYNINDFEVLANNFGKDGSPKPTDYLIDYKVEKKEKEQIVEVQPVENVGYKIVTDKNTKYTIDKKYTDVIPQVKDNVVFYKVLGTHIIGVELNGVLLYFLQRGNLQ